jgi:hypothetical protein
LVPLGQAPNAGKTQSTGRSWPSQARASSVCGQALLPNLGCAEVRVRVRLPCLHEAEQVVHEPHGLEMPVPHKAEQADQAPQALVLQWGVPPRGPSWRLGSAQAAHLACACKESMGGSA